jgi:hypothetical protein
MLFDAHLFAGQSPFESYSLFHYPAMLLRSFVSLLVAGGEALVA